MSYRPIRLSVPVFAVLCLAVLAFARPASPRNPAALERARIQAHILGAERAIAAHAPSGLTAAQRAARAVNLARLEAYRERGVFPHNRDFPGRRAPYFRDQAGVLCAMGHLIAESGRTDLVDLVARARNNATVLELAADPALGPALAAWLRDAGMTVAEAQRVQPGYSQLPPGPNSIPVDHFERNSALLGAISLTTITLNSGLAGSKPGSGWAGSVGFLAGSLQVGLGAANLSKNSTVAHFDMFVGTAAIVTSILALSGGRSEPVSARAPAEGLRVSPLLGMSGDSEPQAGVALSF